MLSPVRIGRWILHFPLRNPLHLLCLFKHSKSEILYYFENIVHDRLSPYVSPYTLISVKVVGPCMRREVRSVGENKSGMTR